MQCSACGRDPLKNSTLLISPRLDPVMIIPNDDVIIEPRKGRLEASLPASAFLVFTPQDVRLILNTLEYSGKPSHSLYLSNVYPCIRHGIPIAVAGPMIGAPQTVLILERLIALGVTDILAMGWCGSLQSPVRVGDVVIPTGCLSEEGTSLHYPVSVTDPGPAQDAVLRLEALLGSSGLKVHKGKTWTTDAPFRETRAKVLEYQAKGMLAVDMEASALFTLAHYRQVRLVQVLVVSDELSTLKWVHGFTRSEFKEARQKVVQLICSAYFSP